MVADKNYKIFPLENGPLYFFTDMTPVEVKGLTGEAGERYSHPVGAALCRCGQSSDKPFCDGSHLGAGFTDECLGDGMPDRMKDYVGAAITIHDNRSLCSHSKECIKNLPGVFDMEGRPWIKPDGASAAEVMETVKKCPSGALSYTVEGVRHCDNECEPQVVITKDGPYHLIGGVEVAGANYGEGASKEHCVLCRCGASHNKPFCDGNHEEEEFKG